MVFTWENDMILVGASKNLVGYNTISGTQQVNIEVEEGIGFFEV